MQFPHAVILSLLLLLSLFGPVSATNSQGFDWAVAAGDEIQFTVDASGQGVGPLHEAMYFRVDEVPELSEDFVAMNRIPIVVTSAYWGNDSEMAYKIWYRWVERLVFPIGDWWLLRNTIVLESMDDYEPIDDDHFWGFEWAMVDRTEGVQLNVRIVYWKEDGFLSQYQSEVLNTSSHELLSSVDAERIGLPMYLSSDFSGIMSMAETYLPYAVLGLIPCLAVAWRTGLIRFPQVRIRKRRACSESS